VHRGSYGRKALVTEPLREVCQRDPKPDHVFIIGPTIMMKFCCEVTRPFGIPTEVSLNTIMVDGTGMCGGCRVEVDGKPKFVCVDGPEFDGHKVNFDLMMKRLNAYKAQEREAHEEYKQHRCKIGLDNDGLPIDGCRLKQAHVTNPQSQFPGDLSCSGEERKQLLNDLRKKGLRQP
jgi:ferredoxin--NADP+ reductase